MTAGLAAFADTTATPAATNVDTATPTAVPATDFIGAIAAISTNEAVWTGTAASPVG